jgi:ankyrin repeat protein
MVRTLMELGADVNQAMDGGATPLFMVAHMGHAVLVRALIEAGADIDKATDNGWTPLSIAAQKGHTAISQILRDAVLVQMQDLSL